MPKIKLCDLSEYRKYLSPAVKICEKFDVEDAPLVALALKYNCLVRSNDEDLREKQKVVRVLTTREIIKSFKELS